MRLSLAFLVCLTAPLAAQYSTDFESLTASASGTVITAQDGYYIPVAGSLDGKVYTYVGNTIGVPTNPKGADNFYCGISQATNLFARAQRPIEISQHPIVHLECDVLFNYVGAGVAGNYLGSWSMQPGTSVASNILGAVGATVGTWDFQVSSPAGIATVGDPAFAGLAMNVWHRWGVTINFKTGEYVDFMITDGVTNVTTVHVPPTPIALNGVGNPLPSDFRFFTGGSDNMFATDNVSITNPQSTKYTSDFEYMNATAAGTIITDQDGFYIPVAGSLDGKVYTYAGNTIGVPTNPNGGDDFYCGISQATNIFARAQREINVPAEGLFHMECDVLFNYVGAATPGNYLGSWSMQPSGTALSSNILGAVGAAPGTWDFQVSAPTGIATVGDPAFAGLTFNTWYRWGTTVDFANGVYVDFTITDLATNVTTVHVPPTPIAINNVGLGLPTGFRFFTGGSDNLFAADNVIFTYSASYETYGTGCSGSLGVPTLAPVGGASPQLGTAFQVELGNLPGGMGVIVSGFSNTITSNNNALPLDLTSNGFPGCFLLADPLLVQFVAGAGSTATWNFAVPPSGIYAGTTYYQQGMSFEGAFSNGGRLQIGY